MEVMEKDHISEEALERYSLGKMNEPEAEAFEEHLLLCADCQDRLQEVDEFISAFRVAAGSMGKEERRQRSETPAGKLRSVFPGLWKGWSPAYALGGIAVAAAVVIAILPRGNAPVPGRVAVELNAVRGTVPVVVAAPGGAALDLSLDLTGLPAANRLKLEIAGASGQVLWTGAEPLPAGGKLTIQPPIQPKPGLYWVRVYDAEGDQSLLREFGLRIRE